MAGRQSRALWGFALASRCLKCKARRDNRDVKEEIVALRSERQIQVVTVDDELDD